MTRPKVCPCGRGYVSAYDGKCGHCRSGKEQKRHAFAVREAYRKRFPLIAALAAIDKS